VSIVTEKLLQELSDDGGNNNS